MGRIEKKGAMRVFLALISSAMVLAPAALPASMKDVYAALHAIDTRASREIEREPFERLLQDARRGLRTLTTEQIESSCGVSLRRALDAYDIIQQIWAAQQADETIESSSACVSPDSYRTWLRMFPGLLTWKWGRSGEGVSPFEAVYFEPFDCCLILQPWFEDVWVPCLLHEARGELQNARGYCDARYLTP